MALAALRDQCVVVETVGEETVDLICDLQKAVKAAAKVGTFGMKADAGLIAETKALASQLGWLVELGRAQQPPRVTELLPCSGAELAVEHEAVDAVILACFAVDNPPPTAEELKAAAAKPKKGKPPEAPRPPPTVQRCLVGLTVYKGQNIEPKSDKAKLAELEPDSLVRVLGTKEGEKSAVLAKVAMLAKDEDGEEEEEEEDEEEDEDEDKDEEGAAEGAEEGGGEEQKAAEGAAAEGETQEEGTGTAEEERAAGLPKPGKGQEPHYEGPAGEELVGWLEMVGPEKPPKGKKKQPTKGKSALSLRHFHYHWDNGGPVRDPTTWDYPRTR